MNRLSVVLLISALFFLGASAQTTEPIQDTTTGHCYWVVGSKVFNFSSALADAASRTSNQGAPGYLATITTISEEAFIAGLITSTSAAFYTGALANVAGTAYTWQAGDEAGVVVFNASGCLQPSCFGFTGPVVAGSALSLFNGTFAANSDSLLLGYIIEFDNCSATPSVTPSPSNPTTTTTTTTTTTATTTAGATVSPSTFRPTITLGTLTTTGKKATTGRKATSSSTATTGRRATTGKVSAASTMSFSAVAVAIAAASMMFLRR